MKPSTIIIIILLIVIQILLVGYGELLDHIDILESNLHSIHQSKPTLIINNREHRGY